MPRLPVEAFDAALARVSLSVLLAAMSVVQILGRVFFNDAAAMLELTAKSGKPRTLTARQLSLFLHVIPAIPSTPFSQSGEI